MNLHGADRSAWPPWARVRVGVTLILLAASIAALVDGVVNADPGALIGCLSAAVLSLVVAVDNNRRLERWKDK